MKLPLVTSYSNLQLRLGHLKILAAMGTRTPTTNEAFERKLASLFPPPPAKASALNSATHFRTDSYIQKLFTDLGHTRGLLNQQNLNELITLGKAFQFLHPTNCSLFESAVVLRAIMTPNGVKSVQEMDQKGDNPLKLDPLGLSRMEHAFFLILVLTTDLPVALAACVAVEHTNPFQLYHGFPGRDELVAGKNAVRSVEKGGHRGISDESLVPYSENNILFKSYNLVQPKAKNQLSITNWKDWTTYFEGEGPRSAFETKRFFRMGKRSSFRHHAAPRLEFLVDLDLLNHHTSTQGEEDSNYCYACNERTQRFASFFKANFLDQKELNVDRFVRERAMQCYGNTFGLNLPEASASEQLDFLVRAYQAVKREIGTTPMWTTALMGSLLALDAGVRLEIRTLYELARQKAQEENATIRLSGGSRFDGEFLIGIAPELLKTHSPKTP